MVYPLPADLLVRLHRTVGALRDPADIVLAPSVCGYRRGSEAGQGYRAEHSRFLDFVKTGLASSEYVGTADVEAFFASTSGDAVIAAVDRVAPAASTAVARVVRELGALGVKGLPPGYGDARLLSNLVLHDADASIASATFCRWVDDYRLFGDSPLEVETALDELDKALHRAGLDLNATKTSVERSEAALGALGLPLESVFHPDRESPRQTRAAVRAVFVDAAADPIARRREIRFSLRRLAALRDPVGIDFALAGLTVMPWELPRLVHYLATFLDRCHVRDAIESHVAVAADADDHWRMARLLPAVASLGLDRDTRAAIRAYCGRAGNGSVWGLALRTLSLVHDPAVLDFASAAIDPRATLAAFADLGRRPPENLVRSHPETAAVLSRGPAPAPSPRSIL